MQEAPNSYEKDEQQERGNYDSAVYMENADGGKVILWVRVPHSPILFLCWINVSQ